MSFGSKQTQAKNEATNQATTGFNNQTVDGSNSTSFGNFGGTNATSGFANSSLQTRDPYAAAKPGLDLAAASARSYLADPTAAQAYGGPRVAGMSGMTAAGLGGMFGQQGASNSMGYLNDVIGGKYLAADNPYLSQLTDSIKSQVMPGINSQFSASGMSGSTLHQGSLARGMSDALAQPLFAQYNNERNQQMQAAGMLPGIDTAAQQARVAAGQTAEGYDQRNYDAQKAAYDEAQARRAQQLQLGSGVLSQIGGVGGTTAADQSGYTDNSQTQFNGGTQEGTNQANTTGQTSGTMQGTTNGTTTTSQNPGLGQTLLGAGMLGTSLLTGGALGGVGSLLGGIGSSASGGMFGNSGLWAPSNPYPTPTAYGFARNV